MIQSIVFPVTQIPCVRAPPSIIRTSVSDHRGVDIILSDKVLTGLTEQKGEG